MQFDLFNPPPKQKTNGEPNPMPQIYNSSEKRQEMLDRLKAGPLSTVEAELFHHRGQATIRRLREEGHIIETVQIGGVAHYRYVGHEQKVRVTPEMQAAYYLTPHWRQTSLQRKQLDGFRCQECKIGENLETHHWRYELFNEDVQRELITLCRTCHENIHLCASGSREMHFPRFVSEEIARRILGAA
jgi:hypothetical protein